MISINSFNSNYGFPRTTNNNSLISENQVFSLARSIVRREFGEAYDPTVDFLMMAAHGQWLALGGGKKSDDGFIA